MNTHVVNGTVKVLDESRSHGSNVTCDYISFEDKNSQTILIKRVRVSKDVDRLLRPGVHGTFIVGEVSKKLRMIAAIRAGSSEAVAGYLDGDTSAVKGTYKILMSLLVTGIGCLVVGIPYLWILIGIPFLIISAYLVWLAIRSAVLIPRRLRELIEVVRKEGFQFNRVRRI
jgi:hypothetical protein